MYQNGLNHQMFFLYYGNFLFYNEYFIGFRIWSFKHGFCLSFFYSLHVCHGCQNQYKNYFLWIFEQSSKFNSQKIYGYNLKFYVHQIDQIISVFLHVKYIEWLSTHQTQLCYHIYLWNFVKTAVYTLYLSNTAFLYYPGTGWGHSSWKASSEDNSEKHIGV